MLISYLYTIANIHLFLYTIFELYALNHRSCLILSIPSNKRDSSELYLANWSSCSARFASGILWRLGSFIFYSNFTLKPFNSSSFLLSLANYLFASIWEPSSRNIFDSPRSANPHPLGTIFSSSIKLIFVTLPRVASKSSCLGMISSLVIMNASGLIWGGKFTPAAIDLNAAANLFTISNFYSTYLKCSAHPSNLLVNDYG